MDKSILIIGLNSELARNTIEELKKHEWNIYATSRQVNIIDDKIRQFNLDVTSELDFAHLKDKFKDMKFDVILNFAGIAIASPVEELDELALKRQLDVNLFGLLRIIKYFSSNLKEKGRLINISSMASYGIFPFLSPYCISKSSCDILLNSFSLESNIKTVSIRPGAIATKFWETSIELNEKNLKLQNEKFKKEKEFLIKNANHNSLHAASAIHVAKKIAHIVELKNPKSVYNIGLDAKFAKLTRFLPLNFVNCIIKFVFKKRIQKKK